MWYGFIGLAVLLLFFSLLQGSFLAHFAIFGAVPDAIFALVILIAFFEKPKDYYSAYLVVFAGLLQDILSNNFLGLSAVCLLLAYLIVKQSKVFLVDVKKNPVGHFIPVFIFCFAVYQTLLRLLVLLQGRVLFSYFISYTFLAAVVYNLVLGLLGFFIVKAVSKIK